jgi:DNA (cytosine-5)-methyltransferase 1
MAEGFRRAGIVFDFVFDKDTDACASYEANHGHRPVQMDVRDLVRMVRGGWSPGPVRLFVADPPCTPWSLAGKRAGLNDERDMLLETVELIQLLRPEAYLIGNVPGLEDSTQWPNLQRALAPLRAAGYCIADFVTLDAADYGVPQHRVRPFWFGHLAGPCIRWPEPTHGDASHPSLPGLELRPWVTCREALGHLSAEELGRPVKLRKRSCNGKQHGSVEGRPARVVGTSNLSDGNVLLNPRHAPAHPAHPAPTLGAKDRGQSTVLQLGEALEQDDGRLLEWPWNRPSTTVCARDTIPPPGHHPESGSILSQPNAVVLSEKAAAILQGFPERWRFCGATKRARWSQIGQAMPPALAEAVARSVRAQMEDGWARRPKVEGSSVRGLRRSADPARSETTLGG